MVCGLVRVLHFETLWPALLTSVSSAETGINEGSNEKTEDHFENVFFTMLNYAKGMMYVNY